LAPRLGELLFVDDHLLEAAAVDDADLVRAKTPGRRGTVHGRVAAAINDHALADLDRQPAVRALEEEDAGNDAGEIVSGNARRVGLESARGDQDGVVLVAKLRQHDVATDIGGEPKLDVVADDAVQVAIDDLPWQPERRHARERRAAGLVQRVKDGAVEAQFRQLRRRSETGAAGADDRHLAPRRAEHRRGRLAVRLAVVAHVLVVPFRQEPLHVPDRQWFVDLFAAAGRFARRGADRAADGGHGIGVERELPGFFELAGGGEVQVAPAVRLDRTGFLAGNVLLIPLR